MSGSYHCYRHNIDHRSFDCPACAREQQHEEMIEAISTIGKKEEPEYTPPPRYKCPRCPYADLARETGFCPNCGTDLKGFWLKLEQKEEAKRKRAFFLSDYSIYECPKCSKSTFKYEQKFCSGCGTKIDDQFWSETRAVRGAVQKEEAEERAKREAEEAWHKRLGWTIGYIIWILPTPVLWSMYKLAQDKTCFNPVLALMSFIPLLNWLPLLIMTYQSPSGNHTILYLLVSWTVAGALVAWAIVSIWHRIRRA